MCSSAGLLRQPEVEAQTQTSSKPSSQPILRIEAGMHVAHVNDDISVDEAGRYLVTCSEDKTVRVWEVATGRLSRTLRPPIGAGDEGKIYAVAISPDGRLIAAGGMTGYEWDKKYSVYIFDRESGRMALRLGGLPSSVSKLAFSPDGTRLAAAAPGDGIHTFRVADWVEIGRNADCGILCSGMSFDGKGRLITTSSDGYLLLYDQNLKLLKKVRAPAQYPSAVSFAPDGAKVALAYTGGTRVDVFDGASLEALYQPDITGMKHLQVSALGWSADGSALYAGGGMDDSVSISPIRRWADAGRGRYQDLAASSYVLTSMAPLADGRVVFVVSSHEWGVFSASGRLTQFVSEEVANHFYFNPLVNLLTDASGSVVGFADKLANENFGSPPMRFSLAGRRLEVGTGADVSLRPPRVAPRGAKPKGIGLALAIAPDAQSYLAGVLDLSLYDRRDKKRWQAIIPDTAWKANISGDGRLAIAALNDGTIRWYRMKDGKELLAFFPHNDGKRWVLWTPGGYYDCSPGAEDLIGWHVNNGKDQAADFFPAERFRSVYYRPDVISRVLKAGDEAIALRQANEAAGRKRRESDLKKQ
jgi:WD40 repeat protein